MECGWWSGSEVEHESSVGSRGLSRNSIVRPINANPQCILHTAAGDSVIVVILAGVLRAIHIQQRSVEISVALLRPLRLHRRAVCRDLDLRQRPRTLVGIPVNP